MSESKLVEKKSRFYGFLYKIDSTQNVEEILKEIKKKHKKSRHICTAFILENNSKFQNDSEVGSPGKLLMQTLKQKELNSHLIIVVRYFGGVKLGIGGVQRAFKKTAQELI